MKRLFGISATVLLLILLSSRHYVNKAEAQSDTFVIQYADGINTLSMNGSSSLISLIQSVNVRFVMQYANAKNILPITSPPEALITLLQSVEDRFVMQYANGNNTLSLTTPPTELNTLLQIVADRFVIQYANASNTYFLSYPVDLIADNFLPVARDLSVTVLSSSSVQITWFTDEYTDASVRYGTVSGGYPSIVTDPLYARRHDVYLYNLTSCTTYYFNFENTDRSGNTFESVENTFIIEVAPAGLTASNNSPTTLGEQTDFSASISEGCNVEFSWDFGDGSTAQGNPVSHVYGQAGDYTVTVTAQNNIGQASTATLATVIDIPIAGLVATNDSPTTLGSSTTLSADITAGSNVTYSWLFGDGTSGTGETIMHIYPDAGSYIAQVTAQNGVSEQIVTTNVTIVDQQISGLGASNNSPTTLGNSTTLCASVSTGTNVSFAWDFGDGATSSTTSNCLFHQYATVGTFSASVIASNSINQQETSTNVTILDIPINGLVAFSDSPTKLGNPTSFWASVSSGSSVVYIWNFGDGLQLSGNPVSHTYDQNGVYEVMVVASNGVGQQSSTITVQIVLYNFLPVVIK